MLRPLLLSSLLLAACSSPDKLINTSFAAEQTAAARAISPVPGADSVQDSLIEHSGNGGYDVELYDLRLAYDPTDFSIDAEVHINAQVVHDLSKFNLDLYASRSARSKSTATRPNSPATVKN